MSNKLFLQIVALIIIFVVISAGAKALKIKYCPMSGKGPMSSMSAKKIAK
ncbi:MAG: hypothetical protein KJ995_05050 [Candidatus Omnitrophica bacterium]|nr:hypothetical protein [Candidatus Omnitrophota bacterium]MBU1128327.1 hypothetical protein [Candidatus Omnitrophota bacterium]MBU1657306.1 hypothetical protein [Candidatus Omnitrophota bacterium]MBU1784579.1 hypothetical protein [Candidatus Omnitrophota bacterium]MBU1851755.1 hypothetical protein [Candidatus Omnitrophota bacterium]